MASKAMAPYATAMLASCIFTLLFCNNSRVVKCAADTTISIKQLSCEELGFTGLALKSVCDTFAEYVKDAELEADCRRCSVDGDEVSKVVYASATLEVCSRKVRFYPAVSTFLEKHLQHHPQVSLKHRGGSAPKLVMRGSDGQVQETIRIDNWKTEHIDEFLKQKLQPSDRKSL